MRDYGPQQNMEKSKSYECGCVAVLIQKVQYHGCCSSINAKKKSESKKYG